MRILTNKTHFVNIKLWENPHRAKAKGGETMSEKEQASIQATCEIYKQLPDYLKGKLDGFV